MVLPKQEALSRTGSISCLSRDSMGLASMTEGRRIARSLDALFQVLKSYDADDVFVIGGGIRLCAAVAILHRRPM